MGKMLSYRPDIDALRAIAVVGVLIFHFFPESFRSGFLGVDVFFVISGFLVTSIISNEIYKKKFSFKIFYFRRVRRLFPSLLVVLLMTTIVAFILLLSDELISYGKHLFFSAVFSTNFSLYLESGYFDKDSHFKPLLHLWSLSVEEQFYFLWPTALIFIHKLGKKFIIPMTVFLILSSFITALCFRYYDPSFGFYMLPTRFWELGIGALLGLMPTFSFKSIRVNNIMSVTGLIFIFGSFISNSNHNSFTSFLSTVFSCLGAALYIMAGSRAIANRLLSQRGIIYLGLISYPLYLWHWPIVSFLNIQMHNQAPIWLKWSLLGLSIVLAIVTYECIEKRFKKSVFSVRTFALLAIPFFAFGGVGLIILQAKGFGGRYALIEEQRLDKAAFVTTSNTSHGAVCNKIAMKIELCSLNNPQKTPTVILIGDSHAAHLYPGLVEYYSQRGENLLLLAKSGTPPLEGIISKRNPDESLDDVFRYIYLNPTIHTVILSAFWGNFYEEQGVRLSQHFYKNKIQDSTNLSVTDQQSVFKVGLKRTLKKLKEHGKVVYFFYDIPTLTFSPEACLPRPFSNAQNCIFKSEENDNRQAAYRKGVKSLLIDYGVQEVDPTSFFCDSQHCRAVNKYGILYSDDHHLTVRSAKELVRFLDENKMIK